MGPDFVPASVHPSTVGPRPLIQLQDPQLKPREALLGNGFVMDGVPEREVRPWLVMASDGQVMASESCECQEVQELPCSQREASLFQTS